MMEDKYIPTMEGLKCSKKMFMVIGLHDFFFRVLKQQMLRLPFHILRVSEVIGKKSDQAISYIYWGPK